MAATIFWTFCEVDPRLPWWTLAGAPDFLSAGEQQRLERLRFPKRRREWLLGRWTVKKLLLASHPGCASLPLAEIEIDAEAGGAPYLLHPPGDGGGTISISHRENAAACAFAPSLAVGIDLEQVETRSDAFVRDFFTSSEADQAFEYYGEQRDRFTALAWSAKESALKALRAGLRVDTRAVEIVEISPPGPDGWGELVYQSNLPELAQARGWWRLDRDRMITLAALAAEQETVMIQQVIV